MSKITIYIGNESDIAEAVRQSRKMATTIGFVGVSSHYIATAASELAANVWVHAGGGVISVLRLSENSGIEIMTVDNGPGIADIDLAQQEGFSTAKSLGCGLSGVKRLMDELHIDSRPGAETVVRARKWLS